MRKRAVVVVVLLAGWALAQTFSAPALLMGPPVATSVSQCVPVAPHTGGICPVENPAGVIAYFYWNGSAWIQLAGPQGVAGPVGPAGPPGPVQSFNSNKCSSWSGGTTGVSMSGCAQSTP